MTPYGQEQQPYQVAPPYPGASSPQPYPVQPYVDQPYAPQQQMMYVNASGPGPGVSRTRVDGTAHLVHLVLTIFTCGFWAPVWFIHWLFTRSKTVHR